MRPSGLKIAVVGLPKSGTTALYSGIKSALPPDTVCMFEPSTPRELAYLDSHRTGSALLKIMFEWRDSCGYDEKDFDRNVVIVRDPRDLAVSSLLFRFNLLSFARNEAARERVIAALREKEASPRSRSLVTILRDIDPDNAEDYRELTVGDYAKLARYVGTVRNSFVYRYEDMSADRYDAINEYLGIAIRRPERLTGWVGKIARKGESGDWRNWFTEEDVEFFRPYVDPILEQFGCDPSWELAAEPTILPEHCSGYVMRLMEARANDPHLAKPKAATLENLLSAVSDGKRTAMFHLAERYERGDGVEASPELARQWLERAAILGEELAASRLGELAKAAGDLDAAVRHFEDAASFGSRSAHYRAGRIHEDRKDYASSLALYKAGAARGETACARGVARAYQLGRGVEVDKAEAAVWLEKAGELGCAKSAAELAKIKLEASDEDAALRWFERAAKLGDGAAHYRAGRIHEDRGNYAESLELYRAGATKGEVSCMRGVARAYQTGRGVAADVSEARAWFQKAAELGCGKSALELGRLLQPSDVDGALRWFVQAAGLGVKQAHYHAGRILEDRSKYTESLAYYRSGAELGEVACVRGVARAYELGRGVAADPKEAQAWASRARVA
jgi:TPR repeat protein